MKGARVVLPGLQQFAGLLIVTGFLLTVARYMLGYNVLNDWRFLLISALVSLLPATVLMIIIFRLTSYRNCSWDRKWPYVTSIVIIQVYLGSFMFCNASGYFLNRWLPAGDSFTLHALVMARSDMGYKNYAPTVTIFGNGEVGEKKVNRETWNRLREGSIVPVMFQQGLFGYTNILKFPD